MAKKNVSGFVYKDNEGFDDFALGEKEEAFRKELKAKALAGCAESLRLHYDLYKITKLYNPETKEMLDCVNVLPKEFEDELMSEYTNPTGWEIMVRWG